MTFIYFRVDDYPLELKLYNAEGVNIALRWLSAQGYYMTGRKRNAFTSEIYIWVEKSPADVEEDTDDNPQTM